jgi:hypothetical protein
MPIRLLLSAGTLLAAALVAGGLLAFGSTAHTQTAPTTLRGTAPACAPATLGISAAVAGGAVTVSPAPDSMDSSHVAQISFLGVPAADLEDITVTGSRSGRHSGRLAAYSQGDGGSFLPNAPFTEGERVSVSAVLQREGRSTPFAWHFNVAEADTVSRSLENPPPKAAAARSSEYQQFASAPGINPPKVTVTTDTGDQAPGDLFLAPYAGRGQYGPEILNGAGQLIWFKPLAPGARAADLRLQEYEGKPVITWWQDPLIAGGRHDSGLVIANSSYQVVKVVRAANGYQPDLHAFEITPKGTGLFTVYDAIRCNLTAHRGPSNGAVADTLFQEVDLKTGLVRYEWHSLDHVALSDSYAPAGPGDDKDPWDFFHINAVSEHGEDLLVNSRNTWAAYWISARTGQIVWRLGGKQSSFHMGLGATPAWQHDARLGPSGTISFFDNEATPKVRSQSRGLVLALNLKDGTATRVASFNHPSKPLVSGSQGDLQPLPGGDWMAGWGAEPYFTEFSPSGRDLFDAHLPAGYQSFTVLKFPWSGSPGQPPAIAVRAGAHRGLIACWNGATAVQHWRLLGGSTPGSLEPLAETSPSGFQTTITTSAKPRYVAVQAIGGTGQVLGTSATKSD